jgi:hypothetical protein
LRMAAARVTFRPSKSLGRSPVVLDLVSRETPLDDGRKVRAPQSTMPGNTRWRQRRGECHREQTAVARVPAPDGKGETAE